MQALGSEIKSPCKPTIKYQEPPHRLIITSKPTPSNIINTPITKVNLCDPQRPNSRKAASSRTVVDLRSADSLTSCYHLEYIVKAGNDKFKNYPVRFRILCTDCATRVTSAFAQSELFISLRVFDDESFKYSLLQAASIKLWQMHDKLDVRQLQGRLKEIFDRRNAKEPQLCDDFLWLMENIDMTTIIPKFALFHKSLDLYKPMRSVTAEDFKFIADRIESMGNIFFKKLESPSLKSKYKAIRILRSPECKSQTVVKNKTLAFTGNANLKMEMQKSTESPIKEITPQPVSMLMKKQSNEDNSDMNRSRKIRMMQGTPTTERSKSTKIKLLGMSNQPK